MPVMKMSPNFPIALKAYSKYNARQVFSETLLDKTIVLVLPFTIIWSILIGSLLCQIHCFFSLCIPLFWFLPLSNVWSCSHIRGSFLPLEHLVGLHSLAPVSWDLVMWRDFLWPMKCEKLPLGGSYRNQWCLNPARVTIKSRKHRQWTWDLRKK